MKVLITGGAGFIGSHTADLFVKAGHRVRVLDNFSSGKLENLHDVAAEAEIIDSDIRDLDSLQKACRDVDAICHLAAVSSVAKSIDDPVTTHAVNATGTIHILEAARNENVKRVVFAGSAAVYGDHPELPKKEESPTQPLSPYAWDKLTGEFYGDTYGKTYGLEFTSLRYFNVYGPRQDPGSPYSGVLSIFVDRTLRGGGLTIFGDGRQTRDFVYVSDVARVNLLAAESQWPLPAVINVATGAETSVAQAAQIIRSGSKMPDLSIEYKPPRQGDIRRSFANIGRLKEALDYVPKVNIQSGLKELVSWADLEQKSGRKS